jgi:hypothetical protein
MRNDVASVQAGGRPAGSWAFSLDTAGQQGEDDVAGALAANETGERSLKVVECSLKVVECSLKVVERSLKVVERSLRVVERSLKVVECSLKVVERSLKVVERSLKVIECSLKAIDAMPGGPDASVAGSEPGEEGDDLAYGARQNGGDSPIEGKVGEHELAIFNFTYSDVSPLRTD